MRIRITRPRNGMLDGVDLSAFHVGHIYDVDQSIANYLVVIGSAEPALHDVPALVVRGTGAEVMCSRAPKTRPEMASDVGGDDDSAA